MSQWYRITSNYSGPVNGDAGFRLIYEQNPLEAIAKARKLHIVHQHENRKVGAHPLTASEAASLECLIKISGYSIRKARQSGYTINPIKR
ncbi:MAG: hypothetical protein ABIC04_03960 [Nanoarchaeota archaeon]